MKTKTIVEINSNYKESELGTMQLLIAAANGDGAFIGNVQSFNLEQLNPHIILFAKRHYQRSNDPTEDLNILKEILSKYTGTPKEYLKMFHCFFWVSDVVKSLLSSERIITCILESRLNDNENIFNKVKDAKNEKDNVTLYSLMSSFLSEIAVMEVAKIPNWDKVLASKYPEWTPYEK